MPSEPHRARVSGNILSVLQSARVSSTTATGFLHRDGQAVHRIRAILWRVAVRGVWEMLSVASVVHRVRWQGADAKADWASFERRQRRQRA